MAESTATSRPAQGRTGQAQEKASEVAGQAKEQAQQATGQAREQLRRQVDERSTQAGEKVSSQASDMRSVAEQLRQQGKDQPAKMAEQVADRTERAGSYLRESDADRILSDVEDFARQRPWAVIAAGVGVGFMASRFLKASSGDRYRGRAGTMAGQGSRQALPAGNELSSGVTADAPRFGRA